MRRRGFFLGASWTNVPITNTAIETVKKKNGFPALPGDNALSVTIFQSSPRHTFVIKLYPQPLRRKHGVSCPLRAKRAFKSVGTGGNKNVVSPPEVGRWRCEKPI